MHRHGYGPASNLVTSHEAAYLEHCRRYALERQAVQTAAASLVPRRGQRSF
jgi:hypothetical protein